MKKILVVSSIVILLAFSVFAYAYSEGEELATISIGDLVELMSSEESFIILDVRNQEELVGQLGHIEGVINIPIHDLEKRIAELKKYKENKVVVICRSGNRSKYGTSLLLQNGFKAFNVEGGMRAYRKVIKK